MDFLEKLDMLLKQKDLNKKSFSRESKIPYTTIYGWYKRGYEGLNLSTLRKIASFFNTSLDFWAYDNITDPDYGKTSGFSVSVAEMEIIEKYRCLNDEGQEKVQDYVDDLVRSGKYKKHGEPENDFHIW